MNINLIAKNKIADYIEQHPETYTYLSTWLKGYKYREGRPKVNSGPILGSLVGSSQLGTSNYLVKYKMNLWLGTAYIIFLGTREEERAYHEKEMEKYMANNPGEKLKTVTITHHVKSTSIKVSDKKVLITADKKAVLNTPPLTETIELTFDDATEEELNSEGFASKEEYEKALERAITIFDAKPETDEFNELVLLLPLIKSYEHHNIKLPKFNALNALNLRLKELNMIPEYLSYTIGSVEKAELLFSGKKLPTDLVIAKVYKRLGFSFPVDRNDFY
ncbi:MAG: hypothetical protein ABIN91_22340 [Mucilaginibacter sp.]|uniref:hypothetical protein n=1 Tax=Mucilaginibacter sp. TaxID=1882438 RepID=UPI0032669C32